MLDKVSLFFPEEEKGAFCGGKKNENSTAAYMFCFVVLSA